jgi:hypothetical protein
MRPQDGVAPGLPLRIGAAGGSAKRVRLEKESFATPAIARRQTDLQVAEHLPAKPPQLSPKGRVLFVNEELGERIALCVEPRRSAQLTAPERVGGPSRCVVRPVCRGMRLEGGVVIEPRTGLAAEVREACAQARRAAACEALEGNGERALESPLGMIVMNAAGPGRQPRERPIERLAIDQPFPGRIAVKGSQRDRERVTRKDRPVVR